MLIGMISSYDHQELSPWVFLLQALTYICGVLLPRKVALISDVQEESTTSAMEPTHLD